MKRLALIAALLWPVAGHTAECKDITHDGAPYTVCEVDLTRDALRLFLYASKDKPHGSFRALDRSLREAGTKLGFAMNAGMYHDDRSPVGLYIENGTELRGVVPNAGPGNFGLLPNGVLCLRGGRADVIETTRYISEALTCRDATQSGPMLVIDGALHPRFLVDSTSRYIRNGVGTSPDGTRAVFAISNRPVTFHQFGTLFRDVIGTPNALYLDGNISKLRAPDLNREDFGFTSLGPIIGVVEPAE